MFDLLNQLHSPRLSQAHRVPLADKFSTFLKRISALRMGRSRAVFPAGGNASIPATGVSCAARRPSSNRRARPVRPPHKAFCRFDTPREKAATPASRQYSLFCRNHTWPHRTPLRRAHVRGDGTAVGKFRVFQPFIRAVVTAIQSIPRGMET